MIVIIIGEESGPWGANVAVGGRLPKYRHGLSKSRSPVLLGGSKYLGIPRSKCTIWCLEFPGPRIQPPRFDSLSSIFKQV